MASSQGVARVAHFFPIQKGRALIIAINKWDVAEDASGLFNLMRNLGGAIGIAAGRIAWQGQDVTTLKGAQLCDWRARCAMIFQQFNLAGRLDVLTNVMMGRAFHAPLRRSVFKLWTDEEKALYRQVHTEVYNLEKQAAAQVLEDHPNAFVTIGVPPTFPDRKSVV